MPAPNENTIELHCPAKINLALSVGSPLPDDSPSAKMHPIASWMVATDFGDKLTITRRDGNFSLFNIEFTKPENYDSLHPTAHCDVDWPLDKDLAFRAHALLEKHTGRPLPVIMRIGKKIPTGAGLGGGSSDAAAALVGINQLFNLDLSEKTLINLGLQLGSDVGFLTAACLGTRSAIVTGLGENIEPKPLPSTIHLTLIFPPFGCPTGPVYQAFDQNLGNSTRQPDTAKVQQLFELPAVAPDAPFNDLAVPACKVQPRLADLQLQLITELKSPVHVSGSGSTLFTIATDHNHATEIANIIQHTTNTPAIPCSTL